MQRRIERIVREMECRKAKRSKAQEVEAATASKGKRNTQDDARGRNGDASGRKRRGEDNGNSEGTLSSRSPDGPRGVKQLCFVSLLLAWRIDGRGTIVRKLSLVGIATRRGRRRGSSSGSSRGNRCALWTLPLAVSRSGRATGSSGCSRGGGRRRGWGTTAAIAVRH